MNATKDKTDDLQLNINQLNSNENEEKEVLEVENNSILDINPQGDASSDGSYSSSFETDSSGIGNDFEAYEDCAVENEGEINDNMLVESAEHHHDTESSNFAKNPSNKIENEVSTNPVLDDKGLEKLNLINIEDNISKEDEDAASSSNGVSLFDSITFPYNNPANCFDVVVPLIGTRVITTTEEDMKPFNHRFDLARERNRLKGIEEASDLSKLSYHEWRKQRDARPQEEKDREERYEKFLAVKTAETITKGAVFLLKEMQKDDPDDGRMERCFLRFLRAPVSPLSVLLSPSFVHVMMYIRGSSYFPHRVRYMAERCYMRCHCMFPILEGYNFETIYTSEVIKNIPKELNGVQNYLLDYDDFEYPLSESDDSAFSEEDYED